MQPVQAAYITDNWRAFRTWGLSANSPWEHDRFWKLRDGFQHRRQDLPVDWDNLQQPGYSPDFIDRTYARFDLAYQRSDWVPTPTAQSLLRNNLPLLAWIAGKPEHFTTKDHTFYPGETVEKQLIVINNSRLTVTCDASWSADLSPALGAVKQISIPTGDQARVPVQLKLPADLAPGNYQINANFKFSTGESQEDSFTLQVIPRSAPPRPRSKVALFDPPGQTAKLLAGLGVNCQPVNSTTDLSGFDVLLIGKSALTVDGPAPDLKRVRDGLKVVVFEQTAEVLEKRLGFRVQEYGLRQVWPRVPDSPLLAGLKTENLHDWRGSSTLLPPTLAYTLSPQFNGAPTVRWSGLEVPRLWRCGNWGNVASVLIEKPPRGDFLPIVDGGYALQYSPLLEYREGRGLVLFCQMDVTGRTESDPAAETLAGNILRYVEAWRPSPRRTAVYAGEPAGLAWLAACGVDAAPFKGDLPAADQVLVVGPGGGRELAAQTPATGAWVKAGGRVLALGLDQAEANSFLPTKVTMQTTEHIAAFFPPFSANSLLAGVAPADIHNRDPRKMPLVAGGATAYGDGVLAANGNVVFCQLPPFQVSKAMGALSSLSGYRGQRRRAQEVRLGVVRQPGLCPVRGEGASRRDWQVLHLRSLCEGHRRAGCGAAGGGARGPTVRSGGAWIGHHRQPGRLDRVTSDLRGGQGISRRLAGLPEWIRRRRQLPGQPGAAVRGSLRPDWRPRIGGHRGAGPEPVQKRELRVWPGIVVLQPRPGAIQPAPHLRAHLLRGEPAAGKPRRVRLDAAVGEVRRPGGRFQGAIGLEEW